MFFKTLTQMCHTELEKASRSQFYFNVSQCLHLHSHSHHFSPKKTDN